MNISDDTQNWEFRKFSSPRGWRLLLASGAAIFTIAITWLTFATSSYAEKIDALRTATEALTARQHELERAGAEYELRAAEFEQARLALAQQEEQTRNQELQTRETAARLEREVIVSEALMHARTAFVRRDFLIAAQLFEKALQNSTPQTPLLYNQAAWSYYLAAINQTLDGPRLRLQARALFEEGLQKYPDDGHLLSNYAALIAETPHPERLLFFDLVNRLAALDRQLAIQLTRAPQTRWIRQKYSDELHEWRRCLEHTTDACPELSAPRR